MKFRLGLIVAFCLAIAPSTHAATVTAAWTASISPGVIGYRIQYGTTPGAWPTIVDVGNVTTASLTMSPGHYFFTVVAYNATLVSPPSIETAADVTEPIDTSCDYPLGVKAVSIFVTALQKTGSGGAGSKARLDFQVASPNSPIIRVAVRTNGADLAMMTGDNLNALAGLWFTVPAAPGTYPLSALASNSYGCVREQSTTYAVTVK